MYVLIHKFLLTLQRFSKHLQRWYSRMTQVEGEVVDPNSLFRILVSTDIHLGYGEKNEERAEDSFRHFFDIFLIISICLILPALTLSIFNIRRTNMIKYRPCKFTAPVALERIESNSHTWLTISGHLRSCWISVWSKALTLWSLEVIFFMRTSQAERQRYAVFKFSDNVS